MEPRRHPEGVDEVRHCAVCVAPFVGKHRQAEWLIHQKACVVIEAALLLRAEQRKRVQT